MSRFPQRPHAFIVSRDPKGLKSMRHEYMLCPWLAWERKIMHIRLRRDKKHSNPHSLALTYYLRARPWVDGGFCNCFFAITHRLVSHALQKCDLQDPFSFSDSGQKKRVDMHAMAHIGAQRTIPHLCQTTANVIFSPLARNCLEILFLLSLAWHSLWPIFFRIRFREPLPLKLLKQYGRETSICTSRSTYWKNILMAPSISGRWVHLPEKIKMGSKWLVHIIFSPKPLICLHWKRQSFVNQILKEKANGQWDCPRKEREQKKTRRHIKNQHGRLNCRCKFAINKQTTPTKGNQNKQIRRRSPWSKEKHVHGRSLSVGPTPGALFLIYLSSLVELASYWMLEHGFGHGLLA